jgi:hypothetical protein
MVGVADGRGVEVSVATGVAVGELVTGAEGVWVGIACPVNVSATPDT